jgi:hypothetical protein
MLNQEHLRLAEAGGEERDRPFYIGTSLRRGVDYCYSDNQSHSLDVADESEFKGKKVYSKRKSQLVSRE